VFLVRQALPKDIPDLVRMARMVYFINLPPNEELLANKVEHSLRCFKKAAQARVPTSPPSSKHTPKRSTKGPASADSNAAGTAANEHESDLFMFVIEDTHTGSVVGTSQVRAHQGGPGNPNWSMQLRTKHFHSDTLGQGTTHTVAQLHADESGPSEVGGLVLQPSHRGHPLRPGKFLSFVRFHFMGLYRHLFAERVLAEMAPPVTSEGDNLFWDHFGRKFIPVKYSEADRFCQHNRKFISELLPKEEIYLTLFPLEVQNMVGVVSRETIPARRLLESLGFKFRGFIDPFDAGPYIDAVIDDIPLVKHARMLDIGKPIVAAKCSEHGILSTLDAEGNFRAVEVHAEPVGSKTIRIPSDALAALELVHGDRVGFSPTKAPPPSETPAPTKTARPLRKRVKA
jgi:arginine N-succinyltransferase